MSGYMTRRDPGIALAVAMPPDGMTSGSSRPCTTSVGACTRRRSHVRAGLALMAIVWRAAPAVSSLRSWAWRSRALASTGSKCGPEISSKILTPFSIASAGSRLISRGSRRSSDGRTRPWRRSPVFDMTDVRLATR